MGRASFHHGLAVSSVYYYKQELTSNQRRAGTAQSQQPRKHGVQPPIPYTILDRNGHLRQDTCQRSADKRVAADGASRTTGVRVDQVGKCTGVYNPQSSAWFRQVVTALTSRHNLPSTRQQR